MRGKTLAERLNEGRGNPEPSDAPDELADEQSDVLADELAGNTQDSASLGEETPASGTDAIVAAARAAHGGDEPQQASRPVAKVCLIVDDSRVIRKVSTKIAKSLGYEAIEAQDGEEALARCKKAMPALVLTDWNMPEMDGIEFVRRLREIPTPNRPTVVFCTSNGEAADIHEGISAGADDYIVKPFDEAALKAKLEMLARG